MTSSDDEWRLRSHFPDLTDARDKRWTACAALGPVLDQTLPAEVRLRAIYDREPSEWIGPAGEILVALERLVTLTRATEPPLMTGLRGALLMDVGRGGAPALIACAARHHVSVSAVRQVVASLEQSGFVTRFRDPDDRRVVRVRATPVGQTYARICRADRAAELARVIRGLMPDDIVALVRAGRSAELLADRLLRRHERW